MAREAWIGCTSDELRGEVERARGARRVVSIASYGAGAELRHAVVWGPDREARQRVELDLEPDLAPVTLARHARDGFWPSGLGLAGDPRSPLLAVVLDAGALPGASLVAPSAFDDPVDGFVARALRAGGHVAAIAAVGAEVGARGAGLTIAGIVAPRGEVRVGWATYLDQAPSLARPLTGDEARTLARAASPVTAFAFVGPEGPRVLALWHDRVSAPWSSPDPFAARDEIAGDGDLDAAALAVVLAARRAEIERSSP